MLKKLIKRTWKYILGLGLLSITTIIIIFFSNLSHTKQNITYLLISPTLKKVKTNDSDKIKFPLSIFNPMNQEKRDIVILITVNPQLSKSPGLFVVPNLIKGTEKVEDLTSHTRVSKYRWDENNLSFILLKIPTVNAKEQLNYLVIVDPGIDDNEMEISFKEDILSNYKEKISTLKVDKRDNDSNYNLQEFITSGDSFLTEQIDTNKKWNFLVGTLTFWVDKKSIIKGEKVSLVIKSKETEASIHFYKDSNNSAAFIYTHPYVGKKTKEFEIKPKDIIENKGVLLVFTWDYRKYEPITLYKGPYALTSQPNSNN